MGSPVNPARGSTAFPHGGLYVMRSELLWVLALCQPIGVNGHGPHKHNDWLSFELCVGDQPVIIDPGTCCYTSNPELRRLFRSTAYHNTVTVDGEDQVRIDSGPFELDGPYGEVGVLEWDSTDDTDTLDAEHTGYGRLDEPVTHRRRFELDKRANGLTVTDSFSGRGGHLLEWHLHLDLGLACEVRRESIVVCRGQTPVLAIQAQLGLEPTPRPCWVSRAYNRRDEAQCLHFAHRADVSRRPRFTMQFELTHAGRQ